MDEDTILLGHRAYRSLKTFMTIVSALRFIVPYLKLIHEEEIMRFLSAFDLNLLPWIFFIVLLGRQLKKVKIPAWLPPLPVILLFVSFVVCALFGWFHAGVEGSERMVQTVLVYGLGNGCFVGLLAMGGYDIAHAFMKEKWAKIKAFFVKIFKKREKNEEV